MKNNIFNGGNTSRTAYSLAGAFVYKGAIDCSSNPNYPAASVGDVYLVSVAGRIGGASGAIVEAGDSIYCTNDTIGGTQAAVGVDFFISQANIDVNVLAGDGLVVNGSALDVNPDNSSIELSADTVRVKALGITDAMLAGSISDSKLSTITTTNKVSGSAVQLATSSALADSTGLDVTVDNVTLENNAGTLRVKTGGITASQVVNTPAGNIAAINVQTAIDELDTEKAKIGANTDITSVLLNQTGLVVKGGDANALTIKPNETLTGAKTLNVIVNDTDRTINLSGDLTVSGAATISGTSSGTNTGDQTNITGNAATVTTNANLTGGVTSVGNAATVTTNANLTGEVTSVGNAATLLNSAVIGKVITGYTSGAGTVAATDTILEAIQKLNGNDASSGSNPNLIINGQGLIAQRGTTFDSTTTPVNSDDTYLLDRMLLLSDGNDIVDVSQETTTVPTGSYSAIKFDVETANKQFGYVQILEAKDSAAIIGGVASLSFKARKGGSNATLETLRAAIISWDSTADTVTSDVVGTWAGAGTDPTLATNWTYENTPSNLTLTTSYQTFSIENVSIDTASTNNVAVFIWSDDTDATVADLAYITDIKLEEGSVATNFIARPYGEEFYLCQNFFERKGGENTNQAFGTGFCVNTTIAYVKLDYTKKRSTPILSVSAVDQFRLSTGAANNRSTDASFSNITTINSQFIITVASGLVANNACLGDTFSTSGYVDISAEL